MRVVAWLLVFQVCGVFAEKVDLIEDKTYRFIVPKEGFRVEICGSGDGLPFLCYSGHHDGTRGYDLPESCPDLTSCLILTEELLNWNKLVHYGGGKGHFAGKCATIKVEERIQYSLNAKKNLNENGTCQWKTDDKAMLEIDVITAVGYTMAILDVTQVPNINESAVPFWVYIVSSCGALAVIGISSFFLYRFIKKPKIDEQIVKEGEKS
uniref:Uncharacterized protein n=1 Tax=Panagrolaimus sp. JU765 TaxID=591449 RepID=A0AC34R772_9BILA